MDAVDIILAAPERRRAHMKRAMERDRNERQGVAFRKPKDMPAWDELVDADKSEILWYIMKSCQTGTTKKDNRKDYRCALIGSNTIHYTQREARRMAWSYFKDYKEVVKKFGSEGADKILSITKYYYR